MTGYKGHLLRGSEIIKKKDLVTAALINVHQQPTLQPDFGYLRFMVILFKLWYELVLLGRCDAISAVEETTSTVL